MSPGGYYAMVRSKNHRLDLRIHVVRYALDHGVRAAARWYQCSRNTVRLWLARYQAAGGMHGLVERSRAPHHCPHKTSARVERQVIRQRKRTPGFGARRLKREFGIPASVGAIARILRQKKLKRPKKKKHVTKRNLRAVKAQYAPLTHLQMDTKYLNDIPRYWPYLRQGYPSFQYTTRCANLGATFLAYGGELSLTYAELTIRRVLAHLQRHGIDPATVTVRTDSGSEFDGQTLDTSKGGFTHTIEQHFHARHELFKGCPNANADVESFHAHEETEFFDIESFHDRADFWNKITTYQHYWNLARPNSYKENCTPLELLHKADPTLPPQVLLLPPVDLDTLIAKIRVKVGQDVPVLPDIFSFLS